MASETELKLEIAARDAKRLTSARLLKGRQRPQRKNLVSVYFDTPKHKLKQNGVSLRVRHDGKRRRQTVKSSGAFSRGEWERDIKGDTPDWHAARDSVLAPLLTRKLKHKLGPIFETRVRRTVIPLRRNGSRIEVALDSGHVRAARRSAPIHEVELELKRGKPAELFALAQAIGEIVPTSLTLTSKSERGYDLLGDATGHAARAQDIALRADAGTADAIRTIGRSILRHIIANAPAVRAQDPEGVHQMRVGLRRLRAAISLFGPLLRGAQTRRIKRELAWLTEQLAPARDLDVYLKSTLAPVRRATPGKRELQPLTHALATKRAAAFKRARNAVDSERYRVLVFDTLKWLETGAWAKRARAAGKIKRVAVAILMRRASKALKKARKLHKLDATHRHKLRIAIKKLRYGSDFFGGLFAGHQAKARLAGYQRDLKALQDCLGALNDIAVHRKIATGIAADGGRSGRRASTHSRPDWCPAASRVRSSRCSPRRLTPRASSAHARLFWSVTRARRCVKI